MKNDKRKVVRPALVIGLLSVLALMVSSETLKLTTTYPSPVGIYNYLITTGNAGTAPQSTTLARNAGNVLLAPQSNPGGAVGIGTDSPQAKLDVEGPVKLLADRAGVEPMTVYGPAASDGMLWVSGRLDGVGDATMIVSVLVNPGSGWYPAGDGYSTNTTSASPYDGLGYAGSVQLSVPIRKGEYYEIYPQCYANSGGRSGFSGGAFAGLGTCPGGFNSGWWIGDYTGYYVPFGHG